ncbi:MAG: hypothetical protein IJ496_09725, partial [Ruminococcus sp.]|nr:hypothetical protein [Ruminococcus sp.]
SSLCSSLQKGIANCQQQSSLHKLHRLLLVTSQIIFVFYTVYLTGGGAFHTERNAGYAKGSTREIWFITPGKHEKNMRRW